MMIKFEAFNPKRIGFHDVLEDGEAVVKVFRKKFFFHFVKLAFQVVLWGGAAFVVWFLFRDLLMPAWLALGAIGVYRASYHFLHWYLNAILMTTENIVCVDWHGFFKKKSIRIDYWNLDTVQVEKIGVRSYIGNYGTLYFMNHHGGETYIARQIARPSRAARIMEAYKEEMVDAKNFTEESALKNLLSQMVQTHVRDHGQPVRPGEKREKAKTVHSQKVEGLKSEEKLVKVEERSGVGEKKEGMLKKILHRNTEIPLVEKELDDNGGIDIDLSGTGDDI